LGEGMDEKRLKIGVACANAPEPRETFLSRDVAVLRTKYDVRVFGLARRAPAVRLLPLLHGHSPREAISLAFRLRTAAEIAEYVADGGVIFAHFAWTTADVAATASQLSGRPWVCFVHAWDVFTRPAAELRRRTATATRIVACSQAAADACAAAGIERDRISVIHHAALPVLGSQFSVLSSKTEPGTRNQEPGTKNQEPGTKNQEPGTKNQEPGTRRPTAMRSLAVIAVGRLVEKKGFDTLIRAWPAVVRALPKATLRIVGDGPCAASLRRLARDACDNGSITFSGALPEEETLSAIASSDMLVLPSRRLSNGDRDGIANVILEAMAIGVPVVTTDAGAAGEVVEDGVSGVLVPHPATEDSLAAAIIRIASDGKMRATLADNARTVVRDEFSSESYLAAVDALLTCE
ncbi:MAG: glycosyltransferase family 4 protein, partial [Kiritimatiellae bacterium]|nr:glycosyltransferase family 4 protein [Kiritimatiellia bacterium]